MNPSYKVIVLDDVPQSAQLVKLILQANLTCDVVTCGTPEEFFKLLAKVPADLYLLDIQVNGASGVEVCRIIRSSPNYQGVPIVFFSAHGDPKSRVSALKAGGIDYIDKPFYPEELLTRIKGHLNLYASSEKLRAQLAEHQALLRVLCHDLRNPIGAAISLLELSELPTQPHADQLGLALKSCEKALELIDHVGQQRSLLGDGDETLVLQSSDLDGIIAEAEQIMHPMASAKNIHFRTEVPAGLKVLTHRVVLIHNVLNNLIHNAIKFSHPDSFVEITAAPENKDRVCIEIADSGIGFPAAMLKSLFSQEKVLTRKGTRDETGSGLGMGLVKRYVERLGGCIAIQSTQEEPDAADVNSGTRIQLSFPMGSR